MKPNNEQKQASEDPIYYGMTLEPFYVGGKNADKLNAFSTQLNTLRSKGFYNEANQLYQDGKKYGVDQALYNLIVKKDIDKGKQLYHQGMQRFWEESPVKPADIAFGMLGLGPAGEAISNTVGWALNKTVAPALKKVLPKVLGYQKIYHGSPNKFSWKNARPYSEGSVGLHVSPRKEISNFFKQRNGNLMEGYIKKADAETIDIWGNDYSWLSNDIKYIKQPIERGGYHYTTPSDKLRWKLFEKYGANPTLNLDKTQLNTTNDITIPLRNETFQLSPKAAAIADDIVSRGNQQSSIYTPEFIKARTQLNKEAAQLLSDEGYKIIKYENISPKEGGGGLSYAITDPSVIKTFDFNFKGFPYYTGAYATSRNKITE